MSILLKMRLHGSQARSLSLIPFLHFAMKEGWRGLKKNMTQVPQRWKMKNLTTRSWIVHRRIVKREMCG